MSKNLENLKKMLQSWTYLDLYFYLHERGACGKALQWITFPKRDGVTAWRECRDLDWIVWLLLTFRCTEELRHLKAMDAAHTDPGAMLNWIKTEMAL